MKLGQAAGIGFAALALLGAGRTVAGWRAADRFDHWQHRGLFPSCEGCHAGAEHPGQSLWPSAANCAACHDGTVRPLVEWRPPVSSRPSNLRFDHRVHSERAGRVPADSLGCGACHLAPGAPWMEVLRADVGRCLSCHGIRTDHLSAPDTTCGTCHLPLVQATDLPLERIARFPAPSSHRATDFGRQHPVTETCATCHAREFCISCHVNAPEVPAIQSLAMDARSLAIPARLEAPPDHRAIDFSERHGKGAHRTPQSCAACHTQESCLTCHVAQPAVAVALHPAGPGRGRGASIERRRPASHEDDFTDRHGPLASSRAATCAACHARADCLDCHRPNAASTPGYHPLGFLARHPASAYARETSCGECHNTASFCADCHQQSGLAAQGVLRGGFHDAKRGFLLAHGPAARQSLESCVSCHAERDCLSCHSAVRGRGFNPHGPGFDPDRLRRHNSQMCTVCHGSSIPRR